MKLPRTLRLDPSDTLVFERAAEPGEWAVTGSFLFWDADVPALTGKARAAFRAGFVGVRSLGFSTLVVVQEAAEAEHDAAVEDLARHIHARFGAPSLDHARAAAREELAFAASLCDHPENTVLAMHRTFEDGRIREQFRSLQPRERTPGADRLHAAARAFEFVEVDEPEERVDLLGLMGKR
ncbi:MAG TPA: DUF6505 family protein [Beijerinckiaceae bacterium]|nr:DUF6505 family protein [Beijerinckiaceae bacterium]